MTRYQELEQQRRALRERLRGASLFFHATRGYVYKLKDDSYMSVGEYSKLRRQCGIYWLL